MLILLFKFFGVHDIWNKIWKFLLPSFQENGVTSSKKISAFIVMGLYSICHIKVFMNLNVKEDSDLYFHIFCLDAIFICVLFGIITTQQLVTIIKLKTGLNNENDKKIKE